MAAIIAGVAGVAWAAPERTTDHAGTVAIVLALALIAIPIAAPYAAARPGGRGGTLAVLSAGCGYAWTAIASKLLTDELAAGRCWSPSPGWPPRSPRRGWPCSAR